MTPGSQTLTYVLLYWASDDFPSQYASSGLLPAKKSFFLSGICCPMCLQITSLWKSCTTLLLNGFSSVCILVCCFRLPLFTNPAPHSLKINVFPPAWHLSWLFRELLNPHSLQSNVFSPICVCICIFRSLPWTNAAPHSLHLKGFS